MELADAVRRRRMVRNFDPARPVPSDVLDRLLESALHAPSAGFTQGWAFLVADGPEFFSVAADAEWRESSGIARAPVVVVPFACEDAYRARYAEPDKAGSDLGAVPYWLVDTAFATMLLLLAATDAGLGALFFRLRNEHAVRAHFGVPDGYDPIGAVALGYAAPDTPSPSLARGRRPLEEVVHRGRW